MATVPHKILNPNIGTGRYIWGPYQPNKSAEAIVLAPIDAVTYPNGLPDGTVLAKITAAGDTQGQYGPYDPAALDGRDAVTALGFLYGDKPASTDAQPGVISARDFTANGHLITWAAAVTDDQKTAAIAGLSAQLVIVRF